MIFGTVDLIVTAVVVVSVIFAFYRGLLRELLGITGWILAAVGSYWSYGPLLHFFTSLVEKVQIWTMVSTGITALIILIFMTLVNSYITRTLRRSSLSGLDRILGAMFGVFRAGLLIVLAWIFIRQMMLPPPKVQELKKVNVAIPYLNKGADLMEKMLPKDLYQKTYKFEKEEPVKQQYSDKEREKLDEMIGAIMEVEANED